MFCNNHWNRIWLWLIWLFHTNDIPSSSDSPAGRTLNLQGNSGMGSVKLAYEFHIPLNDMLYLSGFFGRYFYLFLPSLKLNIAPETRPSQKDAGSFPKAPFFSGELAVSFREGRFFGVFQLVASSKFVASEGKSVAFFRAKKQPWLESFQAWRTNIHQKRMLRIISWIRHSEVFSKFCIFFDFAGLCSEMQIKALAKTNMAG